MNMKTLLSLTLLFTSVFVAQAATATDPYRWTEDPKTPETAAWIARLAVEAVAKDRPEVAKRLTEMLSAESPEHPCAQDGVYFFTSGEAK